MLKLPSHPSQSGFTLLELSIVLGIIALIMGATLGIGRAQLEQARHQNSADELRAIDQALASYAQRNGRLPCPTPINLSETNVDYGESAADCSDSTPPSGITRSEYPASSGFYIRSGGIPFTELQLPSDFAYDDWNHRYRYTVSEAALTKITSSTKGTIRVQDSSGVAITDEALYVLVAHGASLKGATHNRKLTVTVACTVGEMDGENCDSDGIFTQAPYYDGETDANFYDDVIRWRNKEWTLESTPKNTNVQI